MSRCFLAAALAVVSAGGCLAIGRGQEAPGEDASVRVAVVPAISTEKVLPEAPFGTFGKAQAIALEAARGEYESGSFVVRNDGAEDRTVRVEVSPLDGPNGQLPAESIDVKHVLVWYQAPGAWEHWRRANKTMDAFLTPELLVNDPELIRVDRETRHNYVRLTETRGTHYQLISERKLFDGKETLTPKIADEPIYDAISLQPIRIPAGENRQLWVTIHVPRAAPAGAYSGALRLVGAEDTTLASVPVSLQIHDFDLPSSRLEYSMYYRGLLAEHHPTVSMWWKSQSQIRADYDTMLAHGISNPTVYQRISGVKKIERDSPISPIAGFAQILEMRQELGLMNRPLYYVGRPTGKPDDALGLARLSDEARKIILLGKSFGATDVYLYGVDEAAPEALVAQHAAWRRVKELGGKIFAAGYGDHFERSNGMTDLLVYSNPPIPDGRDMAKKQRGAGNRTFMYGNPQSGPEDPLLWRKSFGVRVWQARYDGAMPYAFQSHAGHPWNDWDDYTYRDQYLAYPTAGGPIDTIAFEGLREGIDDVRYLTALENAIAATEVPAPEKRAVLEEAKAYLAELARGDDFDPADVRDRSVRYVEQLRN